MSMQLQPIKVGLGLVMIGLLFGIGLAMLFGINEDLFKDYAAKGVTTFPALYDEASASKIWRYAQRAHFHATGIAAFSIGLVILVALSEMSDRMKSISSTLVGLGSFYPLSWFAMFLLAPSIGREAAHNHLLTESLAYLGVGGLLSGIAILLGNLFFNFFSK